MFSMAGRARGGWQGTLLLAVALACAAVAGGSDQALEHVWQLVLKAGGELVRYCTRGGVWRARKLRARAACPRSQCQMPCPDSTLTCAACQALLDTSAVAAAAAARLQPGVVAGQACPDCPRGLLASRDMQEGELIARVPLALALRVK